MKKKRAFTLLEIMIVIFLIGLIGSIIGYNMKGSLDEGKAFKSEQAIVQITDLLELELAKGTDKEQIEENIIDVLKATGVVKNPKELIKDGWGNPFKIKVLSKGEIKVTSKTLNAFRRKKDKLRKVDPKDEYEEEYEEE